MLFHSTLFGVFFVVVFAGFWLLRQRRLPRVLFLLSASYLFYMASTGWQSFRNVWQLLNGTSSCLDIHWGFDPTILIVFQTVSDYYLALALHRLQNQSLRRWLLAGSIVINLGILAIFKYFDFFAASLNATCAYLGVPVTAPILHLVLPVGISFYTFHTLSYTLDVYYRKIEPARNLFEFALAVVFFPQLVAGPIVRASQFLPQLELTPQLRDENLRSGLYQFLVGLLKKVLIADVLANNLVDNAFAQPELASGWHLLLAIYGYAFQIYGDFSGYSDMAIGAARMLGYELPVNFNLPYLATGMRDFWRRWHISLSTFLRDYLYVPLGGNRGGRWLNARNLMITMLLGGLWHGAAWTFVLWGFYHGALLIIEHAYSRRPERSIIEPARLVIWGKRLLTFHLVCGGWLLFRAQSLSDVGIIADRILQWAPSSDINLFPREVGIYVLLLAWLFHYGPQQWLQQLGDWLQQRSPTFQGAMAAAALGIVCIVISPDQPFIYFQF